MRFVLVGLVLGVIGAATATAEEFFLTGLVDMAEASRAMIYALPSATHFTLKPGEEKSGVKLVRLDSEQGFALARRGTNWLYLHFAADRRSTNGYGKFVVTGDLPPDFTGRWPEGHEPKIIRDHRQGLLPPGTDLLAHGRGESASGEFLAALRNYAKSLPVEERVAFSNELKRYSAPPSDNGFDPSTSPARKLETQELLAGANFQGLSPEAARLLREVLGSPPPALGEFAGTPGKELRDLRLLLRTGQAALVKQRLEQQFLGYASPSSDNDAGDP